MFKMFKSFLSLLLTLTSITLVAEESEEKQQPLILTLQTAVSHALNNNRQMITTLDSTALPVPR